MMPSKGVKMKELSKVEMMKLWFKTLFYNSFLSWEYAMDTVAEPLFYLIDRTTHRIGRIFVAAVGTLIGTVVIIAHLLGIPYYVTNSSPFVIGCLVVIGYWILINVIFHFAQGVRVSPGLPNNKELFIGVTICRKCISPKPSRTHHCSICNRCYLKMDHHCPWLNNCVGHFNHRYFFLTMVYISVGCLFVIIFGANLAYRQIILDDDILPFVYEQLGVNATNPTSEAKNFQMISSAQVLTSFLPMKQFLPYKDTPSEDQESKTKGHTELWLGVPASKTLVIAMIYTVALLCVGAIIALVPLCYWHGKLIAKGETSIEYHINNALRKSQGKNFVNPYNLGRRRNWEIFLGLDQPDKTFWRHVLLPSTHLPTGDGYDWSHLGTKTV